MAKLTLVTIWKRTDKRPDPLAPHNGVRRCEVHISALVTLSSTFWACMPNTVYGTGVICSAGEPDTAYIRLQTASTHEDFLALSEFLSLYFTKYAILKAKAL